jgi:hypothetical protein
MRKKLGPPPLPNKFTRQVKSSKRKRDDHRDKYGLTKTQRHLILSLIRGIQVCITKHDGKIHTYPEDIGINRMRLAGFDRLEKLGFLARGAESPFYYYWTATKHARETSTKFRT